MSIFTGHNVKGHKILLSCANETVHLIRFKTSKFT